MKKILITGPESSGKTTLTVALAKHFDSPWVSEYAREYLEKLNRAYEEEDLDKILIGQLAKEKAVINDTQSFLFCDTGPEVLYIWSEVKYGRVSSLIKKVTKEQYYDLRIICYPDLEWENDPFRETPDLNKRLQLFEQYCVLHKTNNWPFLIAKGDGVERISSILAHFPTI